MKQRIVCWFSCGAASAVATKLSLQTAAKIDPDVFGGITVAYCDPGSEHEDNVRFRADCEKWFDCPVEVLRSTEYADTWAVWDHRRYLAGIDGAPCTVAMKIEPRLLFQKPLDLHVFGYTADARDVVRATLLRDNYIELKIKTPLIKAGLTKAACLAMIEGAGIELPALYKLGFKNNNCIPCVKATSPNYWALVRQHFPDKFERMAALSRTLDVRLCRLKGERAFIDEIPIGHPTDNPIAPACDFLCHIATQDLDQ